MAGMHSEYKDDFWILWCSVWGGSSNGGATAFFFRNLFGVVSAIDMSSRKVLGFILRWAVNV